MMVLVSYDVSTVDARGQKRLRHIAKTCEDVGQRVQNSVFECLVQPDQFVFFKNRLLSIIDPDEDSLRIYYLGSNWKRRVEHFGKTPSYEQEAPIIL